MGQENTKNVCFSCDEHNIADTEVEDRWNTNFRDVSRICIIAALMTSSTSVNFEKIVLMKPKFSFLHLTHFKIYNKGITWIISCLTKLPHV